VEMIRNRRATRSCYFEQRCRCDVCHVVVPDFTRRPCGLPIADCGLMTGWYGGSREDRAQKPEAVGPQLWRFALTVAVLVGLFALTWIHNG